jgi:hypothetical protein
MAEFTGTFYTLCVLHCAERRFCTAINYKDSTEGNEPNCQLTNTTKHKFDETASEKEKTWTFRKIDIDRTPMVNIYLNFTAKIIFFCYLKSLL